MSDSSVPYDNDNFYNSNNGLFSLSDDSTWRDLLSDLLLATRDKTTILFVERC
jgi:hypothetical protein